MDYVRLKAIHHFNRLVALCNVASPEEMADIIHRPAADDVLFEIPYRDDKYGGREFKLYLRVRIIQPTGMIEIPDADKGSTRLTDRDVEITAKVAGHYKGVDSLTLIYCAYVAPYSDGIAVRMGANKEFTKSQYYDHDSEITQAGRIMVAFLELNWLIMNQPQSVRQGRTPADKTVLKATDTKPAKGGRKIYLRMLTLPHSESDEWNKLRNTRTPEDSGESVSRSITCPLWQVRGHMRHYKNGRTVYIAPYRKGRDRDSTVRCPDREYVLIDTKENQ